MDVSFVDRRAFLQVPATAVGGLPGDPNVDYGGPVNSYAWGYMTSDDNPELYLGAHFIDFSALYENTTGLGFQPEHLEHADDKHSSLMVDYDGDGDLDIIQLIGGGRGQSTTDPSKFANRLWENTDTGFVDIAVDVGIDNPFARARSVNLVDTDRDGDLDLFQGTILRADGLGDPQFFEFENGAYTPVDLIPEVLNDKGVVGIKVDDFNQDLIPDILYVNQVTRVSYGNPNGGFDEPTTATTQGNTSVLVDDFNGDNRPDIFLTRDGVKDSFHALPNGNVRVRIDGAIDVQAGETLPVFSFDSETDVVKFQSSSIRNAPALVIVGSDSTLVDTNAKFNLNSTDITTHGEPTSPPDGNHIAVWFDPATSQWFVRYALTEGFIDEIMLISSDEPLHNFDLTTAPERIEFLSDILMLNTPNGFIDATTQFGLDGIRESSVYANSADFDNDGDTDFYILNSSGSGTKGNYFLENIDNTRFEKRAGPSLAEDDFDGLGAFVSTTDFNSDGFVDVLVGRGEKSNWYLDGFGGWGLYESTGNENNWIAVLLDGGPDNRLAVGATVEVVTQNHTYRQMADSGVRAFSTLNTGQDTPAMHFGIGSDDVVQEVKVTWPEGTVDTFTDVSPNQLLQIDREPTVVPSPEPTPGADLLVGTGLADTIRGLSGDDTLKGGNGDDRLIGNGGQDRLVGSSGNDRLLGSRGDDTLKGGSGDNTLTGGIGRDCFIFNASATGNDKITDFSLAEDTLKLQGISATDFGEDANGNAVIELDTGGTIKLVGISAEEIEAILMDSVEANIVVERREDFGQFGAPSFTRPVATWNDTVGDNSEPIAFVVEVNDLHGLGYW